jgi:hypothetical protein
MKPGGKQDLTLAQQLLFLRSSAVVDGAGSIKARTLTWHMTIQPTALSRAYSVTIKYQAGQSPDVFVKDPDLTSLAEDRLIPHVYTKPLRLCLYLPSTGEWAGSKRIDRTIIPWTYLWLFYFEDWLATDDWKGGGQHPDESSEQQDNRRVRRTLARL